MAGSTAGTSVEVRTVCDVVRTTLGPFGRAKLFVDETGSMTNTTVGSQVIEEVDVNAPDVTLLKRAATDFAAEHGDGTTAVVAIAGELLAEAARLDEEGFHPTTIASGYDLALDSIDDTLQRVSTDPDDA